MAACVVKRSVEDGVEEAILWFLGSQRWRDVDGGMNKHVSRRISLVASDKF